jgi:uncharacterized protein YuzE
MNILNDVYQRSAMAKETKIWYDEEGDYLEVIFEQKAGYFKETSNDAVMKKVDTAGNIIGFSILKVSALRGQKPLAMTLVNKAA